MIGVNKIRVVIVDDSPFTVTILQEILEHHGFEVVGSADSLDEVKAVVKTTRPNLVTMDMSMPGTDGFECTRAIYEIDPEIKVIVISSMKDDEIVNEAIRHRVSAYIQKPLEEKEILAAIKEIMEADELFNSLRLAYFSDFKDALKEGISKMTPGGLTYEDEYLWEKEFTSEGIVVTVGIIGKFSGKMFLSMSNNTAEALASAILKRSIKGYGDVANVLTEFTNIVSGNASSMLNRKDRQYRLRVAPPSIIVGKNMLMSPPDFTTHTAVATTDFGKMMMNVGFRRGK